MTALADACADYAAAVPLAEALRRWWQRVTCKHDWHPDGFADWVCPKCGAQR